MDPARYARVRELFFEVCQLGSPERDGFLEALGEGDRPLRPDVERLLEYDALDPHHLPSNGLGLRRSTTASDLPGQTTARSVGSFRIIEKIGQGGMGAAYRAEQETPRRIVALKVIRPDLSSPRTLRRFAFECEVLGRLRHPGIAQIYEAGTATTAVGEQPFFAMELVDGEPLLEFARSRRLSVEDRLELIAKVCDAVHHAHQKGVIHRDLKPGNILVRTPGEQETSRDHHPVILDFGVARAVETEALTLHSGTAEGQLVGTVPYMSPEQASADDAGVDIRSDVYCLGVVCFELLTGVLPYVFEPGVMPDALRAIREDEPRTLGSVRHDLRGDVETIVATALDKAKERRYESSAAMAADIRRYLRDEPILAVAPTRAYQLRRFVRRHRHLVGGVALGTVLLIAGSLGTTTGWVLALRREAEADGLRVLSDRASADAEAVTRFLETTLQGVAPLDRGPDIPVRQLLDDAARKLESSRLQPLVEARLRHTIGAAYNEGLDMPSEAVHHLKVAVALRTAELGPEDPTTIESMHSLARAHLTDDELDDCRQLLERLTPLSERVNGVRSHSHLNLLRLQGRLLCRMGRYLESVELLEQVGTGRSTLPEVSAEEATDDMLTLAASYRELGWFDRAHKKLDEAIALSSRQLGADHPRTVACQDDYALVCYLQGRYDEAERLFRKGAASTIARLGPEAENALTTNANLALTLTKQGKYREAEPILREVLEIRTRRLGEDHVATLAVLNNLAICLSNAGHHAQAAESYAQALTQLRKTAGDNHRYTLLCTNNLASTLRFLGREDEAKALLLETIRSQRDTLGDRHPDTILSGINLACVERRMGQLDAARLTVVETLATARDVLGPDHYYTVIAVFTLGRIDLDLGHFETALPSLEEAVEYGRATRHPKLAIYLVDLGRCRLGLRELPGAEASLLEGHERLQVMFGPEDWRTQEAIVSLLALYEATGEETKAAGYHASVTNDPRVRPLSFENLHATRGW